MAVILRRKDKEDLVSQARFHSLDKFVEFFFTYDAGEDVYVFHSSSGAVTKDFMEDVITHIGDTGTIPTLSDLGSYK